MKSFKMLLIENKLKYDNHPNIEQQTKHVGHEIYSEFITL
jgi:hypothetical protein